MMTPEQRAIWLEKRRHVLTGTDIAAIAGLSPWSGPMDVYCDKVGISFPKKENQAMEWGSRLEGIVAAKYAEEKGCMLAKLDPAEIIVKDGWRGGTPDFFVVDEPRLLEIKTTGAYSSKHWGDAGTDQIPEFYLPQVMWYLSLTEMPVCDVAVLIGGNDFRIYSVERNKALEERLIEIGNDFWHKHVLARVAPPLDSKASTEAYLREKYPKNTEPAILSASPEIDLIAMDLAETERQIDLMLEKKSSLQNKIKFEIGKNDGMRGEGWKCTWRFTRGSIKTNWQAIALEAGATPDLINSHTETSDGHRSFRFKSEQENDK